MEGREIRDCQSQVQRNTERSAWAILEPQSC